MLDFFEENETAYIVMEYVEGITLENYLEQREEPYSFQEAYELLLPIVHAMEKIHKKGVIHRDINPQNLMIKKDHTLKLLDFGSAREFQGENAQTMTVLVKNGYAPLEQYQRDGKQGPWTDVYGICGTLYEMITGTIPQNAQQRQIKDELYSPSAYGSEISPKEEEVLMKGLALDYKNRYKNLKEFCDGFLPPKEKKKSMKKRIAAVLLGICLLAGLGIWIYGGNRESKEALVFAGNYPPNSKEYAEYLAFLKKHAISIEETQGEAEDGQEKQTVYTLSRRDVLKWNKPCNAFHFWYYEESVTGKNKTTGISNRKHRQKRNLYGNGI